MMLKNCSCRSPVWLPRQSLGTRNANFLLPSCLITTVTFTTICRDFFSEALHPTLLRCGFTVCSSLSPRVSLQPAFTAVRRGKFILSCTATYRPGTPSPQISSNMWAFKTREARRILQQRIRARISHRQAGTHHTPWRRLLPLSTRFRGIFNASQPERQVSQPRSDYSDALSRTPARHAR